MTDKEKDRIMNLVRQGYKACRIVEETDDERGLIALVAIKDQLDAFLEEEDSKDERVLLAFDDQRDVYFEEKGYRRETDKIETTQDQESILTRDDVEAILKESIRLELMVLSWTGTQESQESINRVVDAYDRLRELTPDEIVTIYNDRKLVGFGRRFIKLNYENQGSGNEI